MLLVMTVVMHSLPSVLVTALSMHVNSYTYRGPSCQTFLKFQKCPEIVLKFETVLKFYSFGKNVLKMAFDVQ